MMSSAMPSQRWSLRGSPERLVSASTAIVGCCTTSGFGMGAPRCGDTRVPERLDFSTTKTSIGSEIFFSLGWPSERNVIPGRLAHRVADRARDENRVGFRERLNPRRHIDAMDMKIRCVGGHFAEIEPDAKLNRVAVAPDRLVAKLRLDLDGEPQRPVGAVEQSEDAVAGDIGDTAAIVADQRLEKLDRSCGVVCVGRLVLLDVFAVTRPCRRT